jgi:hypothetical protein
VAFKTSEILLTFHIYLLANLNFATHQPSFVAVQYSEPEPQKPAALQQRVEVEDDGGENQEPQKHAAVPDTPH